MKTKTYTSRLLTMLISALLIIPFFGSAEDQREPRSSTMDYLPGTIVIKVKEGIGPFERQHLKFSFSRKGSNTSPSPGTLVCQT